MLMLAAFIVLKMFPMKQNFCKKVAPVGPGLLQLYVP